MSRRTRQRDCAPGLIGVTIVTPQYRQSAEGAVDHWHRMTGRECVILSAPTDRAAYFLKLRLPSLIAPRPICFFDADWWMIKPGDVGALLDSNPGGVTAVKDPGRWDTGMFPWNDCQAVGHDPEQYFNTGFFVCDLACPAIRGCFELARQMHRDGDPVRDFGEQTYLNRAVQELGIPLAHAPRKWNAPPAGIEDSLSIIGLHGMGLPPQHKAQALANWERAIDHGLRGVRLNEAMMPMPYRTLSSFRYAYDPAS